MYKKNCKLKGKILGFSGAWHPSYFSIVNMFSLYTFKQNNKKKFVDFWIFFRWFLKFYKNLFLVQPFWRLLDTSKLTNRQIDKQSIYIDGWTFTGWKTRLKEECSMSLIFPHWNRNSSIFIWKIFIDNELTHRFSLLIYSLINF